MIYIVFCFGKMSFETGIFPVSLVGLCLCIGTDLHVGSKDFLVYELLNQHLVLRFLVLYVVPHCMTGTILVELDINIRNLIICAYETFTS